MPPHEGDHHGPDDSESPVPGLPVRHALLRPGAVATGALIAAAFAILAQFQSVFAAQGPAGRALLDAPRVQSLAAAARSFVEASAAPGGGAVWRPFADATLALDRVLSGSEPGAAAVWWTLAVNLVLHAVNAGLVYVLLANLTKRKLGAPLIAAALFAIHPLAAATVATVGARGDLLATACGLSAAILLVRSPGRDRSLWIAVALWGLGMFAGPCIATLPVIVALGLVAYHEVEPGRLLTARLGKRFAVFAVPAALWILARCLAGTLEGAGPGASLTEALGEIAVNAAQTIVPLGLGGGAPASDAAGAGAPAPPAGLAVVLGAALLAGACVAGAVTLRRRAAGFPLLAWGLTAAVASPLVLGDALSTPYPAAAFLLLLVAEGLEHLYYRWGAALGLTVTLLVFALLPVESHLVARSLRNPGAPTTER